jgi:hypothetical protein
LPLFSAAINALSLMMPPRAQLKIRTPFLHCSNAASSIMYFVSSVSGMWTVM